jgi:hypothetical protein
MSDKNSKRPKKKGGVPKLSNNNKKSSFTPLTILLTGLVGMVSILLALPYIDLVRNPGFEVTKEFRKSKLFLLGRCQQKKSGRQPPPPPPPPSPPHPTISIK